MDPTPTSSHTQAAQVTPSAAYKANAEEVLAKIGAVKVVPVIALDSADDAVPLAHALKYTRPTPPPPASGRLPRV